eukprot:788493-Pleurochrysis_carterae.AAC.1
MYLHASRKVVGIASFSGTAFLANAGVGPTACEQRGLCLGQLRPPAATAATAVASPPLQRHRPAAATSSGHAPTDAPTDAPTHAPTHAPTRTA